MERNPDWKDLARYQAGECSPEEEAALLAWTAADPARREVLDAARRSWEAAGEPRGRWDVASAWARLEPRLGAGPRRPRLPRGIPGRPLAAWAAAAVLAALVVAGVLRTEGWWGGRDRPGERVAQEFITDKGQRARIRLSDGTHLFLAPESRVEIAVDFGAATREIRLSGEAYFDVAPDSSRPFIVYAGGAVTRVRGTAFNVRALPYDSTVRVAVAEGEVSFRAASGEESVVLHRGELGELKPGTAALSARNADLDPYLGWREGRLTFDNTPLQQVAREIERWYGVPVRVGDPALASRRLTASFRDQPVDEVLMVIASTLELEYTRLGQTYVFVTRGTSPVLATH